MKEGHNWGLVAQRLRHFTHETISRQAVREQYLYRFSLYYNNRNNIKALPVIEIFEYLLRYGFEGMEEYFELPLRELKAKIYFTTKHYGLHAVYKQNRFAAINQIIAQLKID